MSSGLLIADRPLQVLPRLASAIGLSEALILQQVHYWILNSGKKRGHYKWTYNSYVAWQRQFPFWSLSTIKRAIGKLEQQGLLVSGNFNKHPYDHTKWYRVNYKALDELDRKLNLSQSSSSNKRKRLAKTNKPIPETISETSTEKRGSGFQPIGDLVRSKYRKAS